MSPERINKLTLFHSAILGRDDKITLTNQWRRHVLNFNGCILIEITVDMCDQLNLFSVTQNFVRLNNKFDY